MADQTLTPVNDPWSDVTLTPVAHDPFFGTDIKDPYASAPHEVLTPGQREGVADAWQTFGAPVVSAVTAPGDILAGRLTPQDPRFVDSAITLGGLVSAGPLGSGDSAAARVGWSTKMAKDPIDHIVSAIENSPYEHHGIRVTETPHAKGEILAPSRVWDDGSPTDATLNGTSAVQIGGTDRNAVEKAIQQAGIGGKPWEYYPGSHVQLLGSYAKEYGYDPGEIIMKDPVVLEKYAKENDQNGSLLPPTFSGASSSQEGALGSAGGKLTLTPSAKPNTFEFMSPAGAKMEIEARLDPADKKNLIVDWMGVPGDYRNANTLGPSSVRSLLPQIQAQFPSARTLSAFRTSGARKVGKSDQGGQYMSIDLPPTGHPDAPSAWDAAAGHISQWMSGAGVVGLGAAAGLAATSGTPDANAAPLTLTPVHGDPFAHP